MAEHRPNPLIPVPGHPPGALIVGKLCRRCRTEADDLSPTHLCPRCREQIATAA